MVVTLLDKMQEDNDTGPLYSTLSTTTAKKKKQVLPKVEEDTSNYTAINSALNTVSPSYIHVYT